MNFNDSNTDKAIESKNAKLILANNIIRPFIIESFVIFTGVCNKTTPKTWLSFDIIGAPIVRVGAFTTLLKFSLVVILPENTSSIIRTAESGKSLYV